MGQSGVWLCKNAPYVGEGLIGCDKCPPCPEVEPGGGASH